MSTHTRICRGARSREAVAQPARTVETAVVLMLIVALFAVAWLTGRNEAAPVQLRQVRVEAGDSLWTLASAHRLPGKSTAETIDVLRDVNTLDGDVLVAGTVLRVPVLDDAATPTLAMR